MRSDFSVEIELASFNVSGPGGAKEVAAINGQEEEEEEEESHDGWLLQDTGGKTAGDTINSLGRGGLRDTLEIHGTGELL